MITRAVYNDVAKRYIRMYGGRKETEWVAIDNTETFLYNKEDVIIARVWVYDNFKKDKTQYNYSVSEIPY